jgi:hypothetical protein
MKQVGLRAVLVLVGPALLLVAVVAVVLAVLVVAVQEALEELLPPGTD